jgi:hypothetical protein
MKISKEEIIDKAMSISHVSQNTGGGRFGSQSDFVNPVHNFVNPVHNLTFFVEPVTPGDSSKSLRGAHVPSLI